MCVYDCRASNYTNHDNGNWGYTVDSRLHLILSHLCVFFYVEKSSYNKLLL